MYPEHETVNVLLCSLDTIHVNSIRKIIITNRRQIGHETIIRIKVM